MVKTKHWIILLLDNLDTFNFVDNVGKKGNVVDNTSFSLYGKICSTGNCAPQSILEKFLEGFYLYLFYPTKSYNPNEYGTEMLRNKMEHRLT